MTHLKLEILLPKYHNSVEGNPRELINDTEFSDTFRDLMKQFRGCTIDNNPLLGGWVNPDTGQEVSDDVIVYWVVCDDNTGNIRFLEEFKGILKTRFKQDDILMYAVSITTF